MVRLYHVSSNFAECRCFTHFKWPYFCIAGGYGHAVGRAGSPTRIVHVDMTLTRSKVKVKVTGLLKFRKLHFSRSISSAILAWSSKMMVGRDSMGPSLQLIRALFSNFFLRSREFKLRGMSILQEFQMAIFPYC